MSYMKNFKKTHDNVDNAINTHDTLTHRTESVSFGGQLFDYASKFFTGRLLPFWTPTKFTAPIENQRQKVTKLVDEFSMPTDYKNGRQSLEHSKTLEEFQRQKIHDFEKMPEWQKKEMGSQYDTQLSSMHEELQSRRETTFSDKHDLEKMKMNFGKKWKF